MLERVWRKGNPLTLLVGMQTSTATMENSVEIPYIMYENELPVQVRCTILDAWGYCTGTTQRDGMGREDKILAAILHLVSGDAFQKLSPPCGARMFFQNVWGFVKK